MEYDPVRRGLKRSPRYEKVNQKYRSIAARRTLHFLMLTTSLSIVLRRGDVGPVVMIFTRSPKVEEVSTEERSGGEVKSFE